MLKFSLRELRFHPGRFAGTVATVALATAFLVVASVVSATADHAAQATGTAAVTGDATKWLMWVFAGVAALTGIIVIANNFTILLTQRQRQLGLLRTVGASGGQLRAAVFGEALILGLAGVLLGIGLGVGAGAVFASATGTLAAGLVVPPGELLGAAV
ncbi:MAG: ABC transporter permease, partial [Propionibacteriaceae bacterium]|nr:ABC transporter permease [Propionibacteriaceae bacterium]